jgi:hypothetical protein
MNVFPVSRVMSCGVTRLILPIVGILWRRRDARFQVAKVMYFISVPILSLFGIWVSVGTLGVATLGVDWKLRVVWHPEGSWCLFGI